MTTPTDNRKKQKQKGQTLFEFALTLPILLLLVFGVIEFGRVFQAWVTLNNAARTAARYASTGQFNETKYVINEDKTEDPTSIVDCVLNQDFRGTLTDRTVNPGETVQVYDGREGLFATWYDGEDCEPNRIDHQDMRKDIARILSINDEARRGAAGLALGPDPLDGVTTEAQVRDFLYGYWERPLPGDGDYIEQAGSDQPSFFEVVICSSRGGRNEASAQYSSDQSTRFITILDPDDITDDPLGQANRAPECILNEEPPPVGGATQNAGTPWLDAGGPGDTVSIIITFNHPLVTPLGLAPYIPLQARRAAVNETFRAAEATGALRGGGAITADINIAPVAVAEVQNGTLGPGGYTITVGAGETQGTVFLNGSGSYDPDGDSSAPNYLTYRWHRNLPDGTIEELVDGTGTPINSATPPGWILPVGRHEIFLTVTDAEGAEDTDTVIVIITVPDPTATATGTPKPLPTSTPVQPFSCDLLTATDVEFFNNRVYIQFTNDNVQETVMTRAEFHWPRLPLYPNMHVSGMSLDGVLHWRGQDFSPPTDTNADPPTPANLFLESDRRIGGLTTSTWEAVFANGPSPLQDPFAGIYHMTQNDLTGTTFTFSNPEGGFCVIPLTLPTPTPVGPASDTPVPVCISEDIDIRFVEFRTFGVVRMTITSLRNFPSELTDFSIGWAGVNSPRLEWVAVGGSSPTDRITGVEVWRAASGQDTNAPTVGGSGAASASAVNNWSTGATGREGTWLTDYTLPPTSTTNVWIKFGVTNSTPDTAFNMSAADVTNNTWFQIGCVNSGSGRIDVNEEPTPFPSNTPGPTNTPRPTYTPSKTFTPGPTNTRRPPATITNTPRPSDTPPPSPTASRVPPGGGGDEGCPDGSC